MTIVDRMKAVEAFVRDVVEMREWAESGDGRSPTTWARLSRRAKTLGLSAECPRCEGASMRQVDSGCDSHTRCEGPHPPTIKVCDGPCGGTGKVMVSQAVEALLNENMLPVSGDAYEIIAAFERSE